MIADVGTGSGAIAVAIGRQLPGGDRLRHRCLGCVHGGREKNVWRYGVGEQVHLVPGSLLDCAAGAGRHRRRQSAVRGDAGPGDAAAAGARLRAGAGAGRRAGRAATCIADAAADASASPAGQGQAEAGRRRSSSRSARTRARCMRSLVHEILPECGCSVLVDYTGLDRVVVIRPDVTSEVTEPKGTSRGASCASVFVVKELLLYRLLAFDYDGTAAMTGSCPTAACLRGGRPRPAPRRGRGAGDRAALRLGRALRARRSGLDAPVICLPGRDGARADRREARAVRRAGAVGRHVRSAGLAADARPGAEHLRRRRDVRHRPRPARRVLRALVWDAHPVLCASYAEICDALCRLRASRRSRACSSARRETNDALRDELRRAFRRPAGGGALARPVSSKSTPLDASKGHGLTFPGRALWRPAGRNDRGRRLGQRQRP